MIVVYGSHRVSELVVNAFVANIRSLGACMYFSHLIRVVTFVVLSCTGISAQAEEKYSDGLLCSYIYFIMSGFHGDNKDAGEMLMGLQ